MLSDAFSDGLMLSTEKLVELPRRLYWAFFTMNALLKYLIIKIGENFNEPTKLQTHKLYLYYFAASNRLSEYWGIPFEPVIRL